MKKLVITLSMVLFVLMGYAQVTNVADFRVANAETQFGVNLPVGTKVYDIANGKYYVATAGVASTATLTSASASFTLLNDAGTDDQTASEVTSTASGNLTSTTVQTALEELQGDINTINSAGYLTSEVDGSTTNEIQTIDTARLVGTSLELSLSSDGEAKKTVDLSSLQDGTGTDDQTAAEVTIEDAGTIITATTVEGALQENRTAIDLNTAKETNVTTDLSLGTVTETTVDVNSSDGSNATITAATNSAAGVMTAAQVTKLEGIATGADVNLTIITENFEANGTPDYAFTLGQTAITAQGCVVSVNGAVLPSTSYTLAATTITINSTKVPLYEYDKIVITYSY